jgi:hypothetical protein
MNDADDRPRYDDPEVAARRLLEIAHAAEKVQDGRIHVDKVKHPFLFQDKGSATECVAGFRLAIERGWLWMHESGTYVKVTPEGAALIA